MIVTVRHKGLKVYLTTGHAAGLNPAWMGRLNIILSKLNAAATPQDMAEPRHRLHRLTGITPTRYSIWLTANWRIAFEMTDGDIFNLDIEDYH